MKCSCIRYPREYEDINARFSDSLCMTLFRSGKVNVTMSDICPNFRKKRTKITSEKEIEGSGKGRLIMQSLRISIKVLA